MADSSAAKDAAVVWLIRKAAKDGKPVTITIDKVPYTVTVKPLEEL